jgi:ketosteroid isomerase-like protein
MQKSRCTVLSGWMGDASRFMKPVKVFPSVETILHCLRWMRQSPVAYCRMQTLQVTRLSNRGRTQATATARLSRLVVITSSILMATNVSTAPMQTTSAVAQIESVLQAQQQAWNRGDIDGFMNGYARSTSTVFISEDTVRRGWETVRDRYRKKYSNRAKMGILTFSALEITLLCPDAAVVLGGWKLQRATDHPHGRFTLVLKRLPEGWRIVHDHTSAAPP